MTAVLERRVIPAPPDALAATNAARRRRRRRLVGWSALPALVLVVIAGALAFTGWATDRGVRAYGARDADGYGAAVGWFEQAAWLNVHERYVPPFDRGDALFRSGDFERARLAFEEAYALAPDGRRCMVVVNLVLTLEAEGDALAVDDEVAAQPSYNDAVAMIDEHRACLALTTPAGDGEGDRLARAADRLTGKILQDSPTRRPRQPSDEPAEPEPPAPEEQAIDELERRMEENAEARREGREISEGLDRGLVPHDGPSW